MLTVEDTGYEIDPPQPGDEEKSSVAVRQTLYSSAEKVRVVFNMRRNAEGRWQFRNVNLEGVNLGGTFRNQFKRAAEEFDGDIDQVIENWSSDL